MGFFSASGMGLGVGVEMRELLMESYPERFVLGGIVLVAIVGERRRIPRTGDIFCAAYEVQLRVLSRTNVSNCWRRVVYPSTCLMYPVLQPDSYDPHLIPIPLLVTAQISR